MFFIEDFIKEHQDARVSSLPLSSTPLYAIFTSIFYIFFVKILGPFLLRNKQPYKLKEAMLIYNFFQVALCSYMVFEYAMAGWLTGELNLNCQPIGTSRSPRALRMINAMWWYHFSKYADLLDTVFFVLRKKYDHITFLHVIHHSVMPITSWIFLKFGPDGHATFMFMLNCLVHVTMYGYYFLAALGPEVQKYLWWKKYLTLMQLIQFLLGAIHSLQLLFIDCEYPRSLMWLVVAHAVGFFALFVKFYQKSYQKKAKIVKVQNKTK